MIEFVCGRSGRGKTQYIFDAVKESVADNPSQAIYLIVPDQMSFQTEFALLQQLPNGAMMRVEVVGVARFLTQMIARLDPLPYIAFESLAQKMLLLQAGFAQKKELEIYQNMVEKPEFITYLQQFGRALKGTGLLFGEVFPYGQLAVEHPILFKKMQETERIFSYYQTELEPKMFDIADKMRHYLALLEKPENQVKLKAIDVYIDGFYTFNHLEVDMLSETLRYANRGKITFSFDVRDRIKPNSIFWPIHKQFMQFSEKLNAAIVRIDTKNDRFVQTNLLSLVERHYEKPLQLTFSETKPAPIDVAIYQTIEQEISGIAQAIRQKIVFEDVRAKEIAVYVPQKELYAPIIEKYFAVYGIPYYLDLKDSMLIHPVFHWFFSLLQIIKRNWQMEDILNLLHNDFFRTQNEITTKEYYLFIDFVQQIKYPYKNIWQQDKYWLYYEKPDKFSDSLSEAKTKTIQRVKTILQDTIQTFEQMFQKQAETTDAILCAVFEYIQGQNVYQYISQNKSHKIEAKYLSHVTETQYQETVWKQLVYLFDQAHLALGKKPYDKQTFIAALILGLEEAEFTSVPQGFDAVMIGDFARTKFQTLHQEKETKMGIQYAYIVGVNDQFVPHQEEGLTILSAEEVSAMQQQDMLTDILIQDEAINYQCFHFYTLVTSAAKEVHLSYYQYGGLYLEDEYFPSPLLKSFTTGFGVPVIQQEEDVLDSNFRSMSLAAAKQVFVRDYNRHATNQSDLWKILQGADPLFIERLHEAAQFKNNVNFAQQLLLPQQFSLTQIETYNRCPYQYFLKYVLKIKEPYQAQIQPFQTGALLHDAYELLARAAQEQKVKLNELVDPAVLVGTYFKEKIKDLENHPIFNVLSNKYIYQQTEKIVEESLRFVLRNEEMGSFVPNQVEYQLPEYDIPLTKMTAHLIAKVDRIDFDTNTEYLRIIDYKSSSKALDFNSFLYGTQLQLPIYTYLTLQKFNKKLAGSLYVPLVEEDVLLDNPGVDADAITLKKQKKYQATGILVDDADRLLLFDKQLAETNKSLVISYSRNKDGVAGTHATVFQEGELETMQAFAMQQATTTLQQIVDQVFPVTPLREDFDYQTTPCKYCPFRGICQFDQKINCYNEQERRIRETSFAKKKDKFLDIIAEKQKEYE